MLWRSSVVRTDLLHGATPRSFQRHLSLALSSLLRSLPIMVFQYAAPRLLAITVVLSLGNAEAAQVVFCSGSAALGATSLFFD